MNTFEHWNITTDDLDDGLDEALDNSTESRGANSTESSGANSTEPSPAGGSRILPVLRTGTRVVGGVDSMKGEVPWQVQLFLQPLCNPAVTSEYRIISLLNTQSLSQVRLAVVSSLTGAQLLLSVHSFMPQ